jgi:hypothetical protein
MTAYPATQRRTPRGRAAAQSGAGSYNNFARTCWHGRTCNEQNGYHEKWTYGGARGIFAESPNRVFLLGGGELPNMPRPRTRLMPEIGPNVQFPVPGLPWRNANTASPPGAGGSRQDPAKGMEMWRGDKPPYREMGVDSRWHHSIIVVDAQGNFIEDWTQWDNMFKRPHAVYISPYDAQKRV